MQNWLSFFRQAVVLAFSTYAVTNFITASAQADACGCSAVLDANLLDVFEVRLGSQGQFTSRAHMCQLAERSSSGTGGHRVRGFYKAFGLGLSSNRAYNSFDFTQICSSNFQNAQDKKKIDIISRSVNPSLATSFSQCINACKNEEYKMETTRLNQILTINIANKGQTINKIRDILLNVEDIDSDTNEDKYVKCSLRIGRRNIDARKSTAGRVPKYFRKGIQIPESDSAVVHCRRKVVKKIIKLNNSETSTKTKTLEYYPGYTVQVQVNDDVITQSIPVKPLASMTSLEYDYLFRIIHTLFNRRWTNKGSYRNLNIEYRNEEYYPIEISVVTEGRSYNNRINDQINTCSAALDIKYPGEENWNEIQLIVNNNMTRRKWCSVHATIPPKVLYRIRGRNFRGDIDGVARTDDGRIRSWWELR